MAVSLLSHDVSDLCIGKPPVKSLPTTCTVGEALFSLKLSGETFIGVLNHSNIVGKICMVDVLCYLCDEINILDPGLALKSPIGVLVEKGDALVRKIDANSSILEALDAILESSSQTVLVPTRPLIPTRKKQANQLFAWLTQEDIARFFLNNIFLFSQIAPQSITALNLIRPATLSIPHHSSAITALPLLRSALLHSTSVAVTTDDGKLVGEISPSTLSTCDETVAAAISTLSARDLMSYIDCCSCCGVPESVANAVKARLSGRGLDGMLELVENGGVLDFASSSSSSSLFSGSSSGSGSSASSDDDEEEEVGSALAKRRVRRMRSGSFSGRKSEEVVVCHPESSLVAVLVQALAHRVGYVWVVDEDDYGLVGLVTFRDILKVFREQLS